MAWLPSISWLWGASPPQLTAEQGEKFKNLIDIEVKQLARYQHLCTNLLSEIERVKPTLRPVCLDDYVPDSWDAMDGKYRRKVSMYEEIQQDLAKQEAYDLELCARKLVKSLSEGANLHADLSLEERQKIRDELLKKLNIVKVNAEDLILKRETLKKTEISKYEPKTVEFEMVKAIADRKAFLQQARLKRGEIRHLDEVHPVRELDESDRRDKINDFIRRAQYLQILDDNRDQMDEE